MKKVLILLTFALFVCPTSARAWDEQTHVGAAIVIRDSLPDDLRILLKRQNKDYLAGVTDAPELFDALGDVPFTPDSYLNAGMKRFDSESRRVRALIAKKSDPRFIAYAVGQLTRLIMDIVEPMPGSEGFRASDIIGSRVFFEMDFEANRRYFRFLFDGARAPASFPVALGTTLDDNRAAGEKIYAAYRAGNGYATIKDEAEKSFNRALNFTIDALVAIRRPAADGGRPFDPDDFLRLNRFKHGGGGNEMKIASPKKPSVPAAPSAPKPEAPKPEKKNGKKENISAPKSASK